jgi:transcriptional regulator with XRE-family HTH domain
LRLTPIKSCDNFFQPFNANNLQQAMSAKQKPSDKPAKLKQGGQPKGDITRKELAQRVGVSVPTLWRWEKEEGINLDDEAAVRERAARVHETRDANEDEKAAKLRKLKGEADMIEHKLSVQRGEFVPSHEMDKDGVQMGIAVASIFSRMPDDLAPLCAGRTAGEIKKIVARYARDKRTELSQYESRITVPVE